MSPAPPEDDAVAAEYALGTLDGDERSTAETRRAVDARFDAQVRDWELRFAPLSMAVEEMTPPLALRALVLSRIESGPAPTVFPHAGGSVIALRRRVRLWQTATSVAAALAAVLALWIAKMEWQGQAAQQSYVAVLQQGSAAPAFLVSLDLNRRTMSVVPSAAVDTAGKSLQLWMIVSDQSKPMSLGLIDAKTSAHPSLPAQDPALISKATYAVTLEPPGGSPTGQPTSAPVYVGHLLESSP